jgi:hypothetical protein
MDIKDISGENNTLLKELSECSDANIRKLADELHNRGCGFSHTDQCGYYYGGWETKEATCDANILQYAQERIINYNTAKTLLEKFSNHDIAMYLAIDDELDDLS